MLAGNIVVMRTPRADTSLLGCESEPVGGSLMSWVPAKGLDTSQVL